MVDTNVFISGIFFTGPPYEILSAWRGGKIRIFVSTDILTEYVETGNELAAQFPDVDLSPWLELLTIKATLVTTRPLNEQVCTDPDDDKFLACALAARTRLVVSGDKALLRASGYAGIRVISPRKFVNQYLS